MTRWDRALLRTVARLAPAGVEVTICSLIGEQPLAGHGRKGDFVALGASE